MTETEKNKLWEGYSRHRTAEVREKLIIEYAPLVKIVAGRLSMYLGYNVEYDDLVGYGIFGLIDAIDKFDYGKGIKFETYASLRIRGAILDQIRKMDWIPRSLRQKQKKIDAAMNKLELELGRPATDEELAKEIGISEDELLSLFYGYGYEPYIVSGTEPLVMHEKMAEAMDKARLSSNNYYLFSATSFEPALETYVTKDPRFKLINMNEL